MITRTRRKMDIPTQKRLDEIGTRYIRGAVSQVPEIQVLAARIHDGDYAALADLEHLTHQLSGSAAMFHFDAVSATARKINSLLQSFETPPERWNLALLDGLLVDLGDAIHDAAASRARRTADKRAEWPDQPLDASPHE